MSGFSGRERFSQRFESGLGLAVADDLVSVSIVGSCVSVGTSQPMDRARTADVLNAMNGAFNAGSIVVIAGSSNSVSGPAPIMAVIDDRGSVEISVVGAGMVAVECEGSTWTVDMSAHRFLRGEPRMDLRFVPAAAWTPFHAVWISGDAISACVDQGNYVTARRSVRQATPMVHPVRESWVHRIAS